MDTWINLGIVTSNVALVVATVFAVHHTNKEAQLTAREAIESESKLARMVVRMFGGGSKASARHMKGGGQ